MLLPAPGTLVHEQLAGVASRYGGCLSQVTTDTNGATWIELRKPMSRETGCPRTSRRLIHWDEISAVTFDDALSPEEMRHPEQWVPVPATRPRTGG